MDFDTIYDQEYEDTWEGSYLDRYYGGAPDECSWHFRNGEIVRYDDKGDCPRQSEHGESIYA